MSLVNLPETTLDALLECGYQDIINGCEQNINVYVDKFLEAAQKARDAKNSVNANALALLSEACSPTLNSSDPKEPFKPFRVWHGKRSIIPSDFSVAHGQLFVSLAPKIQNPELASRLADLGWIICKDHNSAVLAIDNYIASSQSIYCQDNCYERIKRLERALRLSLTIRGNKKEYIIKKLLTHIDADNDAYDLRVADTICELLLDTCTVPPNIVAEKALILAEQVTHNCALEFKCSLLNIAVQGFHKSMQPDEAEKAKLKIAEIFLQEAERSKTSGGMMLAAHWYSKAINQLQACKGQKQKILEIQPKINETIKASFKEMQGISIKMDDEKIREIVKSKRDLIIHEDCVKTIICFSLFSNNPLERKLLEEMAIETAQNNPISSSNSRSIYNGDGKLVAIHEPLLGSTGEKYISALLAASYRVANFLYACAYPITLHLIQEINKIHNIDEEIIGEVLKDSSFLPNDRLRIWVRGFLAGFRGEFDIALSLLIPQFEHALRKIFETKDAIVWRIDPKTGFHSEKLLDTLLELDEARELLGEDLQFELKGLLTERLGSNYRNEFAHGLLSEQNFHSPTAVYIWWLFLHIVVKHKQGFPLFDN